MRHAAITLSCALLTLASAIGAQAMCRPFVRPQQPVLVKGDQRVFIYHRRGMQHLVLQNSFEGQASDFGMILPLPAPPEIKKVDRKFFAQLIQLTNLPQAGKLAARESAGAADTQATPPQVVVINRQVVGVFEAVTLGATDADALTKWLDDNRYTYDKTAVDLFRHYVAQKWVFVAIRAKLGAAKTRFDGALQPMGFRFPTDAPVLPTRMAAANPKGMFFDMYIVTDHGVTLPDFPAAFCKHRQALLSSPRLGDTLRAGNALGRELARDGLLDASRADRGLGAGDGLPGSDDDRVAAMRERLAGLFLTRYRGFFPRETMLRRDLVIARHDPQVERIRETIRRVTKTGQGPTDALIAAASTDAGFATLVAEIDHDDFRVRRLVAETLGRVGRKQASTAALIGRLKVEQDKFVLSGIVASLRQLTGQSFASYEVDKWTAWWAAQQQERK